MIGGSSSIRGFRVRNLGPGTHKPSADDQRFFQIIGGDYKFLFNTEIRVPITKSLSTAVFVDAGNIWNIKNSKTDGTEDSTQFKFRNIYKQLGVSAGTGFRLDFSYFVLRFDFGFRFKRPDLFYINDGWKVPAIGFDNFFSKIFSASERQWRYENFNFTVGISYPF